MTRLAARRFDLEVKLASARRVVHELDDENR